MKAQDNRAVPSVTTTDRSLSRDLTENKSKTEVVFQASDGYQLGGTRYGAIGVRKGRIILASATAVPQGFYRRFAEYCAAGGYEVLTFDYRGIGRSKPPSLKNFNVSMLEWGRKDLAAAIDYFSDGKIPLFLVGHSYGGHALGLAANHGKLTAAYIFGTGAGWHGYMPRLEQIKVLLMWNFVLPLLTAARGFCPWKMLGMGEDLPASVFKEWRHWCRFRHYFFDDPSMPGLKHEFADVRIPIVAINSTDDRWATPASRDAFVSAYVNSELAPVDLQPTHGSAPIGHMGYFRSHSIELWKSLLDGCSTMIEGKGGARKAAATGPVID